MYKRIGLNVLMLVCIILGGCVYDDEPVPKIVDDYSVNKSVLPALLPRKVGSSVDVSNPIGWVPALRVERRWTAIVIHHSGTENGSAAIFDKSHKQIRHWEGVGYDFVIGNGTNSGDGEVEVTFRWRRQMTGAHCKTPNNWANEEAVGICLVGDFDRGVPTRRQMQSLVKLVRFLQKRYRISKSRIYGHKNTPGARATDCPGRNFPMARLKSLLDF